MSRLSRGDEIITKSIVVIKQIVVPIRPRDPIDKVPAVSEGSGRLVFCGSFGLAVFRSWLSGLFRVSDCVVTVLFTWMVSPLVESCSPFMTLSVSAEFSATLLEALLRCLLGVP